MGQVPSADSAAAAPPELRGASLCHIALAGHRQLSREDIGAWGEPDFKFSGASQL
jgi:hypothetical protein